MPTSSRTTGRPPSWPPNRPQSSWRQTEKRRKTASRKSAAVAAALSQPSLSSLEKTKLVQSELAASVVIWLRQMASGRPHQNARCRFQQVRRHEIRCEARERRYVGGLRAKQGRVCPLVRDHGFKADGDHCVKISCRAGYRVTDDNECEKVQQKKSVATRDEKTRNCERQQMESSRPKPQVKSSDQIFCSTAGCRPVHAGCGLSAPRGLSALVGPRRLKFVTDFGRNVPAVVISA